jgi:hypothetical protein
MACRYHVAMDYVVVRRTDGVDVPEIATMWHLLCPDAGVEEYARELISLLVAEVPGKLTASVFVAEQSSSNLWGSCRSGCDHTPMAVTLRIMSGSSRDGMCHHHLGDAKSEFDSLLPQRTGLDRKVVLRLLQILGWTTWNANARTKRLDSESSIGGFTVEIALNFVFDWHRKIRTLITHV